MFTIKILFLIRTTPSKFKQLKNYCTCKMIFEYEELNQLMNEEVENEVKIELGNEYTKFIADLNSVRSNK